MARSTKRSNESDAATAEEAPAVEMPRKAKTQALRPRAVTVLGRKILISDFTRAQGALGEAFAAHEAVKGKVRRLLQSEWAAEFAKFKKAPRN
jgi:hypothetical protein